MGFQTLLWKGINDFGGSSTTLLLPLQTFVVSFSQQHQFFQASIKFSEYPHIHFNRFFFFYTF